MCNLVGLVSTESRLAQLKTELQLMERSNLEDVEGERAANGRTRET